MSRTDNLESAKHFTQTGDEHVINDVISKLRFISKVKRGEKLNVKEFFVRDNDDITQRMIRTFRNRLLYEDGENKAATLTFFSKVTDTALNLICFYRRQTDNTFNNNIAKMLTENLEDALNGMEATIKTYETDRIFSSQLETMIATLKLRLEAFNN